MICWLLFPVGRLSRVASFMIRQLGKIRKDDAESMTQGGTVVVVVVVVVAVVVGVVVITCPLVSMFVLGSAVHILRISERKKMFVKSFLFEECSVCWTIHTPRKIASARKTVKAAAITLHRFHDGQPI